MYHLRLKGSHYEMGRKLGRIFERTQIKFPLEKLDGFQRKFGTASGAVLKDFFPKRPKKYVALPIPYMPITIFLRHGLCVWVAACIISMTLGRRKRGAARLLLFPMEAKCTTAETMTCRRFCTKAASESYIPPKALIVFYLIPLRS